MGRSLCAFGGVKAILACKPVLLDLNSDAPFQLAVDTEVVARLLQVDAARLDGPVAYFSKKLYKYQRAYSTIKMKVLGCLWFALAVKHLGMYVSHSQSQSERLWCTRAGPKSVHGDTTSPGTKSDCMAYARKM